MSYKTVLVHVDSDQRCELRVQIAARLAVAEDAHLVGLHASLPVYAPTYMRSDMGEEWTARQLQAAQSIAAESEAKFKSAAQRAGASRIEWRVSHLPALEAFRLHARYADLIVIGQFNPDEQNSAVGENFPQLVALQSGRPVLVIPYAGRFDSVGQRVLIAWNATRESVRAVTDALPLLRRAAMVTVLAVNPPRTLTADGWTPGADLALFLARHGVTVEARSDSAVDVDVGNYLLSRATDLSVDLIVLGAYGHARLRELVLGGVTRTMMQHMTVPVLLSH